MRNQLDWHWKRARSQWRILQTGLQWKFAATLQLNSIRPRYSEKSLQLCSRVQLYRSLKLNCITFAIYVWEVIVKVIADHPRCLGATVQLALEFARPRQFPASNPTTTGQGNPLHPAAAAATSHDNTTIRETKLGPWEINYHVCHWNASYCCLSSLAAFVAHVSELWSIFPQK